MTGPDSLLPPTLDRERTMKPLLGVAIAEAVRLALIDSCVAIALKLGADLQLDDRIHTAAPASPGPGWAELSEALGKHLADETRDAIVDGGPGSAKLVGANGTITALERDVLGYVTVELDGSDAVRHHIPLDAVLMVERELTDDERQAMAVDEHAGPRYVDFDPGALAGNVACRLLGTGGWKLGDVYTGNATPQEVLDLSIERPNRDRASELVMGLALHDDPPQELEE